MIFRQECIDDFLNLFDSVSPEIRNSQGCMSLRLVQDKTNPNIICTISEWSDEQDLLNYKNSDLFSEVWPKTKSFFAESPEAWSVETLRNFY